MAKYLVIYGIACLLAGCRHTGGHSSPFDHSSDAGPDAGITAQVVHDYIPSPRKVEFTAWVEHDTEIIPTADACEIRIHDEAGRMIATFRSSAPDKIGVFRLTWDVDSTANALNVKIDMTSVFVARAVVTIANRQYMSVITFATRPVAD